jgi:predicted amidohydrolase
MRRNDELTCVPAGMKGYRDYLCTMKPALHLSLIQTSLYWEQPEKNLEMFSSYLDALSPGSADIVVLPEMFTTGFSMSTSLASMHQQQTIDWMKKRAALLDAALLGSIMFHEGGKIYNRLFFVSPNGDYQTYDKRHLFTMAGEDEHYAPGVDRVVVHFKGWRILLQICYDLRFPVFARNKGDYDLSIYTANWPDVRISAWDTLLKARASENACYTVGVNRVGTDGTGKSYNGHSAVYNMKGECMATAPEHDFAVVHVEISLPELHEYRNKFPVINDADDFQLI